VEQNQSFPKSQDSAPKVSAVNTSPHTTGNYIFGNWRGTALLLPDLSLDIICLLLLVLEFSLSCSLCWWRLSRGMTSRISNLFFLHDICNLCRLSKKVEISSYIR
jgi:hypothetical protein